MLRGSTELSLQQQFSTRASFASWGYLAMARDIFDCHNWGWWCAIGIQQVEARDAVNILCAQEHLPRPPRPRPPRHRQRMIQPQMSVALRLRNPALLNSKPTRPQNLAQPWFSAGYKTTGMNSLASHSLFKESSTTILESLESYCSFPLSWAC